MNLVRTALKLRLVRYRCGIARGACVLAGAQLLVVWVAVPRGNSQGVDLFPKLRARETITYYVSYHAEKFVKTESPVVSAAPGDNANIEVHALLRFEALDLHPMGNRSEVRARTYFEILNSDLHFKIPRFEQPGPEVQREPKGKAVEFTMFPDGRIANVVGFEALFPEQQQAWQEWASRFALGGALPAEMKMGQYSKSDEPEKSSSAIDGLLWVRESRYVRDEPCRAVAMSVVGELASSDVPEERCAVILTTATLKQRSSPKNATPQAFRVRELRTSGRARGTNRIITYVSLRTGLVVRSTEEANQTMDVTVAKTDGSNRVRYNVKARSHSEVLLVTETALNTTTQPSP